MLVSIKAIAVEAWMGKLAAGLGDQMLQLVRQKPADLNTQRGHVTRKQGQLALARQASKAPW